MADNTSIGKGSLSKAKDRSSENSPHYIGSITFDRDIRAGEKLWLAAWLNEPRDGRGDKYISLRPSYPTKKDDYNDRNDRRAPPPRRPSAQRDLDDEIPF